MFKRKKKYGEQHITYRKMFKEGDIATKLSFVIMGAANFANKQFVKGCIFLFIEIGFFAWFIRNGIHALAMLQTLGTKKQGLHYDAKLGIDVLQQGDNSMLLLLFGIAAILLCVVVIVMYVVNLRSARNIYELKAAGNPVPTFKQDMSSLLNERFHMT